MKKVTLILTIFAVFTAGAFLSGCGDSSSESQTTETAKTEQHQQEEQQTEASGEHAGEGGEHSQEVHLTAEQRQTLGIEVETLLSGSATATISRPASVAFDLDRISKVGPRIKAKAVKVLKDLGDPVKEGEAIALMSSVELGKIKADYIRLNARLKAEQARFEREQSLYKQDISSQAELLEAEANYQEAKAELNATAEALRLYGLSQTDIENIEAGSDRPLSYFYLSSPTQGVIQKRALSPGQTIGSSETPVHVVDLSRVWVMIDAYEQDIAYIDEGQKVSLSVRSIDGQTFEGEVDWVSYALEEDTRTMPVRAVVENPNGLLREGMFGTARIFTGKKQGVAMVPVGAVQTIEGETKVFVPGDEPGSFKPVTVMLGEENEGFVEIVSGLQPGDKAVTAGAFDLKSALTAGTRSAAHGH